MEQITCLSVETRACLGNLITFFPVSGQARDAGRPLKTFRTRFIFVTIPILFNVTVIRQCLQIAIDRVNGSLFQSLSIRILYRPLMRCAIIELLDHLSRDRSC